jgi:hypothetical protein
MKCPKCESYNVIVNGLYYHCEDCGEIDDSTFNQIMEAFERYSRMMAGTKLLLPAKDMRNQK